MSCIFCGRSPEPTAGPHHIIPRTVRKLLGWNGKQAQAAIARYTVPLCAECHVKVNDLQEPLVKLIKYLTGRPPVPAELIFIVDGSYKRLNQEAKKVGKCGSA